MSSMLGISMLGEVAQRTSTRPRSDALHRHRTVAALARHLAPDVAPDEAAGAEPTLVALTAKGEVTRTMDSARVLPFNTEGSALPLFFVAPVSGQARRPGASLVSIFSPSIHKVFRVSNVSARKATMETCSQEPLRHATTRTLELSLSLSRSSATLSTVQRNSSKLISSRQARVYARLHDLLGHDAPFSVQRQGSQCGEYT